MKKNKKGRKRPRTNNPGLFSLIKNNLILLCLLSFVFISSSAMALSDGISVPVFGKRTPEPEKQVINKVFTPIPHLKSEDLSFPIVS